MNRKYTSPLSTRLSVMTALAVIMSGVMLAQPQPALGDTPKGVDKYEFRKVQEGWNRRHVEKVFDVKGKITSKDRSAGFMTKIYPTIPRYKDSYVFTRYEWRGGRWRIVDEWWCGKKGCIPRW